MSLAYVNIGCGFRAPKTWRNFDASPTLRFERIPLVGRLYTRNAMRFPLNVEYGDILKGLPVEQARAVFASHILEHLSLDDFRVALGHIHKMLAPGGYFRLVVPDLEALARAYLDSESPKSSHDFMRGTCLGVESRARGIRGLAVSVFGNSKHLWMWDYKSLREELAAVGFENIRRCQFNDSEEAAFRDVEDEGRFRDAVAVECRR
jgi:SAM-dependent methyltransferase